MTHFGNAQNNWGNSIFISNSMGTITSRGEIDTKFSSEIYMKCLAIGEPLDFMIMNVNQCNIFCAEGRITGPPIRTHLIRTRNNPTVPLHYAAVARVRECKNQKSTTIPLLEELCLKKVFLNFERKQQVVS